MDQRVSSRLAYVVACLVVTGQGVRGVVAAEPEQKSPASPLDPVSALAEFQLNPRFRIEVAAAEPQVVDPVAVRFDENGRMLPSSYYERIVDVVEELMRFTVLLRPHVELLTDRYSERKADDRPLDPNQDLSAIAIRS